MSLLLKKSLKNIVKKNYKIIPQCSIKLEQFDQNVKALPLCCGGRRESLFSNDISHSLGARNVNKHFEFRAIHDVCRVDSHRDNPKLPIHDHSKVSVMDQ